MPRFPVLEGLMAESQKILEGQHGSMEFVLEASDDELFLCVPDELVQGGLLEGGLSRSRSSGCREMRL
jgi:hypothetical protein